MKNRTHILLNATVLIALVSVILPSCSVEKMLGKEYRELRPDSVALLLMPDYLLKYNLKTYDFPGIDTMPQWQQDSILLANSIFLKQITDSIVLTGFRENFKSRLGQYNIQVLEEQSLDTFLLVHHSGFLVNIAQISVEEYIYPYSFDYDLADEVVTVSDVDLNALNINVWVEISRLNSEQKNKVLFASNSICDELEGYFRQYLFTGKLQFEYTIDTLTMEKVDSFTNEMGTTCATYLYDYFLNDYIRKKVSEKYPYDLRPLHWDPEKSLFDYIEPEKQFIELEQGKR
jgi:hypothetical protein